MSPSQDTKIWSGQQTPSLKCSNLSILSQHLLLPSYVCGTDVQVWSEWSSSWYPLALVMCIISKGIYPCNTLCSAFQIIAFKIHSNMVNAKFDACWNRDELCANMVFWLRNMLINCTRTGTGMRNDLASTYADLLDADSHWPCPVTWLQNLQINLTWIG